LVLGERSKGDVGKGVVFLRTSPELDIFPDEGDVVLLADVREAIERFNHLPQRSHGQTQQGGQLHLSVSVMGELLDEGWVFPHSLVYEHGQVLLDRQLRRNAVLTLGCLRIGRDGLRELEVLLAVDLPDLPAEAVGAQLARLFGVPLKLILDQGFLQLVVQAQFLQLVLERFNVVGLARQALKKPLLVWRSDLGDEGEFVGCSEVVFEERDVLFQIG
jgi:hypothetical protein